MTQVFVAIPLVYLEESTSSSSAITCILKSIFPELTVDKVFWTKLNMKKEINTEQTEVNKCVVELRSQIMIPTYSQFKQKYTKSELLTNSLDNMKDDLKQLLKQYQELKRQNKRLTKKVDQICKQKQNSNCNKSLNSNNQKEEGNDAKDLSLSLKERNPKVQEPLSISLEVHSKVNSSDKQRLIEPAQSTIQTNFCEHKKVIADLEKQIGNLTRQNLQLKNTVIYYETRLQFFGQYLKKMQEEKKDLKETKQKK